MINMTEDYQEFIKSKKVLRHSVNGISRFLILWIIKYNGSIHGYAIIQELDDFFSHLISQGAIKKFNASKIYPILKNLEESELIVGEWKNYNNQRVKYYQITKKGEGVVQYIFESVIYLENNPKLRLVYEDLAPTK